MRILFMDVGSTAKAAELGDTAGRETLQRHRALIRRQLFRFRGRGLDTADDGFFAVFDGPGPSAASLRSRRPSGGSGWRSGPDCTRSSASSWTARSAGLPSTSARG
jgi:class 3 adenylate cyclase